VPKRTTNFQTIVAFVRQHFAAADVRVEESRELYDPVIGEPREVDVVIEGTFDGDPVMTSIEVVEHQRRATLPWVQAQVAKHRTLPTTKLVLISKSGFTETALKAVAMEGGWVEALAPRIVKVDGEPLVKSIDVGKLDLRPTQCVVYVGQPDGSFVTSLAAPDAYVYDAMRAELGSLLQLTTETLQLDWLRQSYLDMAHNLTRQDEIGGFSCRVLIGEADYFMHNLDSDQMHVVLALEVSGEAAFVEEEMTFTLADLGDRRYGSGEGTLMGMPGVWVVTEDAYRPGTVVSWKVDGGKSKVELPSADEPRRFCELPELRPPDKWADNTEERKALDPTLIASMGPAV
jgi:hypothetical protein